MVPQRMKILMYIFAVSNPKNLSRQHKFPLMFATYVHIFTNGREGPIPVTGHGGP
jgi:hypothetical protein